MRRQRSWRRLASILIVLIFAVFSLSASRLVLSKKGLSVPLLDAFSASSFHIAIFIALQGACLVPALLLRKHVRKETFLACTVMLVGGATALYNAIDWAYDDIEIGWWYALGNFAVLRYVAAAWYTNSDCAEPVRVIKKSVELRQRPRAQIKVYVYDLPMHLTGIESLCFNSSTVHYAEGGACFPSPNRGHEFILPDLLRSSYAYTQHPREADFFYVPAYLAHYFMFARADRVVSRCPRCGKLDQDIVQFMRGVGAYWDRRHGTDHIVASLRCPGTHRRSRFGHAFPRLWAGGGKGPIQLCVETPSASVDARWSIKVPYTDGIIDNPMLAQAKAMGLQKKYLLHFSGSNVGDRGPVMEEMERCAECHVNGLKKYKGPPVLQRVSKNYYVGIMQANFSLVPRGDTPLSSRFYQAVLGGSVPVVMVDGVILPFEAFVDYSRFVVQVDERAAVLRPRCLIQALRELDPQKVATLQRNLADQRRALVYTNKRGGAVDYILWSLQYSRERAESREAA